MDGLQAAALRRASDALKVAMQPTPVAPAPLLTDYLRDVLGDRWTRSNSAARRVHDQLCAELGEPDSMGACRILPGSLATRDLNVTSGGGLTDTQINAGLYAPALLQDSRVLSLGAQTISVPRGASALAIPAGTTPPAGYWLANETATIGAPGVVIGSRVATAKILAVHVTVSRQLLLQSNAEEILRREIRRNAGVALDTATLGGLGIDGQPLGIFSTPDCGTFDGSSCDAADLRAAQQDVLTAGGPVRPESLAFITTPAVATLLATREKVTDSGVMLWTGASAAGQLEGVPAYATASAPTGALIHGDFSQVLIAEWDRGAMIEADPYTNFQTGAIAIRLLWPVDIVLMQPLAFTVGSVT